MCAIDRKAAYPHEVGSSRLDVQIQQIEDNPVGQVAKAAVVHNESLTRIDHLFQV